MVDDAVAVQVTFVNWGSQCKRGPGQKNQDYPAESTDILIA
jgi:hypothetical protein